MEEFRENPKNTNLMSRSAEMEIDDIVRELSNNKFEFLINSNKENTVEDELLHINHSDDFDKSTNNFFYQFPLNNNNITTIDISSDKTPSFIFTPNKTTYHTCGSNFSELDNYTSSNKPSTIIISDDSKHSSLLKTSKTSENDDSDQGPVYIKTYSNNLPQNSQIPFQNVLGYKKNNDDPNIKYLEYLNITEEEIKKIYLNSERIDAENNQVQDLEEIQPIQHQQQQLQELPAQTNVSPINFTIQTSENGSEQRVSNDLQVITTNNNSKIDYTSNTAPNNINYQINEIQPIRANSIFECNKVPLNSCTSLPKDKQLKFTYRIPLQTKYSINYGNVPKTPINLLPKTNGQEFDISVQYELASIDNLNIEIQTVKEKKSPLIRTGRKQKLTPLVHDDGLEFVDDKNQNKFENEIQKFKNNHDAFVTKRQHNKSKFVSSTPYRSPPKFSPRVDDASESSTDSEFDKISPSCLKCSKCKKLFKTPRSRVIHQKGCKVTIAECERIKECFDFEKDLQPSKTEYDFTNQPELEKRVTRSVAKYLVNSGSSSNMVKSLTDSKIIQNTKLLKTSTFSCSICDKKFRQESYFKSHLKTHKNTFSCEFCFKNFNIKKAFDDHLRLNCEKIPPIKRRKLCNTRNQI